MTPEKTYRPILIDADVIFHFISNLALSDLSKILNPHPCFVLTEVCNEVNLKPLANSLLNEEMRTGRLQSLNFPLANLEIKKEYALLTKKNPLLGAGERACMAVAMHTKDIIASSNFRDIAAYCHEHDIDYIGTLDILYIAYSKGVYSEEQCDRFIAKAIDVNKARFPKGVTQIKYYIPKDLRFIALL